MELTMAKSRTGGKADGDEKSDGADEGTKRVRNTAPVQLKTDLARMAAVIASHDSITQAELLDAHLRPFLRMHYERVQKEIADRIRQMKEQDRE